MMENLTPQSNPSQAPGPKWSHILIPLVVLVLLVIGYGVLAKNNNWWPHTTTTGINTSNWIKDMNSGFEFTYPSSYHLYRRNDIPALANYDVDKIENLPQNGVVIQIWHGDDNSLDTKNLTPVHLGIFRYRFEVVEYPYQGTVVYYTGKPYRQVTVTGENHDKQTVETILSTFKFMD